MWIRFFGKRHHDRALTAESFSLGIDRSGALSAASFLSEDGGAGFVPLSAWPVIEGNAMIRASEAPGLLRASKRSRQRAIRGGRGALATAVEGGQAPARREIELTPPWSGDEGTGRDATALINNRILASSGSGNEKDKSPTPISEKPFAPFLPLLSRGGSEGVRGRRTLR